MTNEEKRQEILTELVTDPRYKVICEKYTIGNDYYTEELFQEVCLILAKFDTDKLISVYKSKGKKDGKPGLKNYFTGIVINQAISTGSTFYKTFKKYVDNPEYDYFKLIKKILGNDLYGTILEIGAGDGILTCKMTKIKGVNRIYALDYSSNCVEKLMPYVIKKLNLSENEKNLIFPVIGSFNDIKLPDNSVDFVISWTSLHHSEDRERTLKEIYRVLKVNGYLIALEKASPNTHTNLMLNNALDSEYDFSSVNGYGYDPSKNYTRRMNSEHTPILAEWEYWLAKCGFNNKVFLFQYVFSGVLGWIWRHFGKHFFKLYGDRLLRRGLTDYNFIKIPYFPWFLKDSLYKTTNILIVSRKESYLKMP